jgi:hypothetical protein
LVLFIFSKTVYYFNFVYIEKIEEPVFKVLGMTFPFMSRGRRRARVRVWESKCKDGG